MKESTLKELLNHVFVGIPFGRLVNEFWDQVMQTGIRPEIGWHAEDLDAVSQKDAREAATAFERNGTAVTFHAPFFDFLPGSSDRLIHNAARTRIEQVLELAAIFRPRILVCHTGFDPRHHNEMVEEYQHRCSAFFSEAAVELEKHGGRLAVENVFERSPEELLPVLDGIPGQRAGFCLDPGHAHALSETSLEKWVEGLGGYFCHVHLHDNPGTWDAHQALGSGTIDFHPLFTYLAADKHRPVSITLEPRNEVDLYESIAYLAKHGVLPPNQCNEKAT